MLARLPSLSAFRLWSVLLIAVIGLQASLPAAPSLDKTQGSAFTAMTYEVVLFVQRADRGQRETVVLPESSAVRHEPMPALELAMAERSAGRPDTRGPPDGEVHVRQPAPRGPPYA